MTLPTSIRESIGVQVVRIIVPFGVAVALLSVVVSAIQGAGLSRSFPAFIGISIGLVAWWLARVGRGVAASTVMLLAMCLAIVAGMVLNGGVRAPVYFGALVVVTFATMVYGGLRGALVAGCFVLCGLTFVLLQRRGLVADRQASAAFIFIVHTTWLLVALVIVIAPMRLLHRALLESEERRRETTVALKGEGKALLSFAAAFEQSFQSMCLLDPQGRVVAANRTALATMGVTGERARGIPLAETSFVPSEDRHRLEAALAGATSGNRERFQSFRGAQDRDLPGITFDVSVGPFRDESEEIVYLIAEARDITELLRIQAHLNHAQQMEAVGMLAAGVAHDFGNVLTGISMSAELIGQCASQTMHCPTCAADAQVILDSVDHGKELTRKLVDLSQPSEGEHQRMDLNVTIVETLSILARTMGKSIQIVSRLHGEPISILGDPTSVKRMLVNLAVNAGDAMPDGGTFTVLTELANKDPDWYLGFPYHVRPDPMVTLSVQDSGVGIEPEHLDRLFDPFFTTKQPGQGSGLGLASVLSAVREHGGAVEVQSEPGRGTTFLLYFPLP